MNLYTDISPGKNAPQEINVVIEIPSGGVNKIEYNEKEGYFELDRGLYSAVYYPYEYGFVPQTHGGDGDALDIILLSTHPTFSGCVIKARPIGFLVMEDEAGVDNKIIAVPVKEVDPRFEKIQSYEDLEEHIRKEMQQFLLDYKKLEDRKNVKFGGWKSKEEAEKIILKAMQSYQEGN